MNPKQMVAAEPSSTGTGEPKQHASWFAPCFVLGAFLPAASLESFSCVLPLVLARVRGADHAKLGDGENLEFSAAAGV